MESHAFGSEVLRAEVLAFGAELCRLQTGAGLDLLWPAAPAWPRHAPVLFPIVGRLRDDALWHGGQRHTLTQHGFARDLAFRFTEKDAEGCELVLEDSEATRARYPFRFHLALGYRVQGDCLHVTTTVRNPGEVTLPVSFGAHPAFRWPIEPGRHKEDYSILFAAPEPGALRRVEGGLLTKADRPSPVQGRRMDLTEALFAEDALIWEAPASRSLRYGAAQGPALEIGWEGFSQLGLWSRAGADFLCIEPWAGMASPAGFTGAFSEKPWLRHVPPGGAAQASWHVRVLAELAEA